MQVIARPVQPIVRRTVSPVPAMQNTLIRQYAAVQPNRFAAVPVSPWGCK